MANGNGKTMAAWISIAVTVISIFTIQAIAADTRNRDRDAEQDEKISTTQADVREIRTKLTYIERAQEVVRQEQKDGFAEIKGLIKNIAS